MSERREATVGVAPGLATQTLHMTVRKFTLLYAAAILLSLPLANAEKLLPPLPPPIEVPSRDPVALRKRHLPPAEYDHDYAGDLLVVRASDAEVRRLCYPNIKPGQAAIGCAFMDAPKKCRILIVTDDVLKRTGYDYDIVLRHEVGHCNGWHHDAEGNTIVLDPLIEYGIRRAKELGAD
jgi:hypothetical protein